MKLQAGQIVQFGNQSYQIRSFLGRGAMSDAYLAFFAESDPPAEVVIKLVHDQAAPDSIQAQAARTEAAVLRVLNAKDDPLSASLTTPLDRWRRAQETRERRTIIALLDDGLDTEQRPFTIQEVAPAAFQRLPIEQYALPIEQYAVDAVSEAAIVNDEHALMFVARAIAQVIDLAHTNGYALKDFDPRGEKLDRIRVDWQQPKNIKIIDWNITAGPDASEQEKATDLLYLGGYLYYFITADYIDLRKASQLDIGYGLDVWKTIHEGSQQIIQKLLVGKYSRARDLRNDLDWWVETLAITRETELEHRLRLAGSRHDRKLAVANLMLRRQLSTAEQQRWQQLYSQARRARARSDLSQIEQGILNLRGSLFRKASEIFTQQLASGKLSPEVASIAELYRLQAECGAWLRSSLTSSVADPLWQPINEAVAAIQEDQWEQAVKLLENAVNRSERIIAGTALERLLDHARNGQLVQEYLVLQRTTQNLPQSLAAIPDWMNTEQATYTKLQQLYQRFEAAASRLPANYGQYNQQAEQQLKRSEQLVAAYQNLQLVVRDANQLQLEAQTALHHTGASYQQDQTVVFAQARARLGEAQNIVEATQPYATNVTELQSLLKEIGQQIAQIDLIINSLQKLPETIKLIEQGNYDRAEFQIENILRLLPHYAPAELLLALAKQGGAWQKRADQLNEQAQVALRVRDFRTAHVALQAALELDQKLLASAFAATHTSAEQSALAFRLRNASALQQFDQAITRIEAYRSDALATQGREHRETIDRFVLLRRELALRANAFDTDELACWEQAERGQQQIETAEQHYFQARSYPAASSAELSVSALKDMINVLKEDVTPRAGQLRDYGLQLWLTIAKREPAFSSVHTILDRGVILFENHPGTVELHSLHSSIQEAVQMVDLLAQSETGKPNWLAGESLAAALAELSRCYLAIQARVAQSPLTAIHQSFPLWQQQLQQQLFMWFTGEYGRAAKLAQEYDFDEADALAQQLRQIIPAAFLPFVRSLSAQLQLLEAGLKDRHVLVTSYTTVVEQLANRSLSLKDAIHQIQPAVSSHEHVSVTDLVAFYAGLQHLSRIVADGIPTKESPYWLYAQYTRPTVIAEIQQNLAQFKPAEALKPLLAELGAAGVNQAIDSAKQVGSHIAAVDLAQLKDTPLFVDRYYTLLWWQAATAQSHPQASITASKVLQGAQEKLQSAILGLWNELSNSTSLSAFTQLLWRAEGFKSLTQQLTDRSAVLQLPTTVVLDSPALLQIHAASTQIANLKQIELSLDTLVESMPQMESKKPTIQTTVALLKDATHQIQTSVATFEQAVLQIEGVEAIFQEALLPPNPDTQQLVPELLTAYNQLAELANQMLQVVETNLSQPFLAGLATDEHKAQLLVGLATLQQQSLPEREGVLDWLTNRIRSIILAHKTALTALGELYLQELLQSILTVPDAQRANTRLYNEILRQCPSEEIAVRVTELVDLYLAQIRATPQRRRFLEIIKRATKDWGGKRTKGAERKPAEVES